MTHNEPVSSYFHIIRHTRPELKEKIARIFLLIFVRYKGLAFSIIGLEPQAQPYTNLHLKPEQHKMMRLYNIDILFIFLS
jgi:hypothetical protein